MDVGAVCSLSLSSSDGMCNFSTIANVRGTKLLRWEISCCTAQPLPAVSFPQTQNGQEELRVAFMKFNLMFASLKPHVFCGLVSLAISRG